MSEHPKDPAHELRKLWQQLEAPAPDGPGDEATKAAVAWAQAAWKSMAPEAPQSRPRQRPRPKLLLPVLLPIAASAAALMLWIGLDQRTPKPVPPAPTSLTASAPAHPRPIADGSLELRRGRVRLILIDNPTTEDL